MSVRHARRYAEACGAEITRGSWRQRIVLEWPNDAPELIRRLRKVRKPRASNRLTQIVCNGCYYKHWYGRRDHGTHHARSTDKCIRCGKPKEVR